MASNKSTLGKAASSQHAAIALNQSQAMTDEARAAFTEQAKGNDHTGIPNIDLSAIRFAQPKAVKGKSTRPFCGHVYRDGTKCKLRVTDGGEGKCVNHVPAETRITEQEAIALSGWLEGLTAADRLVAYVRAAGWFAAKEQAKELQTTKQ